MKDKLKSKVKLKKAARGLNDVAVPEAGNTGNALSSGLSMGATGSQFGPWGTAIGTGVGVISGLIQKGKQDAINKQALLVNKDNKMNRQFDGVDETVNQKLQPYKKGTKSLKNTKSKTRLKSKLIEAEDREHVFDKDLNHKGVVTGKTHKEGGEVVEVEEGDSIFPAKHKEKVDTHLRKGDKQSIKKLRAKLPKDTNSKNQAAMGIFNNPDEVDIPDPIAYKKRNTSIRPVIENGAPLYADNLNRDGRYGDYNSAVKGLDDNSSTYLNRGDKGNPYPYSVIRNGQGTMYKHNLDMSPLKPKNLLDSGIDSMNVGGIPSNAVDNTNPMGEVPTNATTNPIDNSPTTDNLGNIGQYANVANNLIRGFQKLPTIEQNYLDPELLKYTDRSESLRRDSRGNQSIQGSNARNLSGGMISNIRANQTAAGTQNLENQDSINEREMGRADQVDNTNVGIRNNAKQLNLGRKDAYQDQLMKQKAVQEDYTNAATQEVTQIAEQTKNRNEEMEYLRSRDAKEDQKDRDTVEWLNGTTRYKADLEKKDGVFNDRSGATSTTIPGLKKSTTKTINAKGKEITKTTTAPSKTKSSTISDIFGRGLKRSRKLR